MKSFLLLLLLPLFSFAQKVKEDEIAVNPLINGTLFTPASGTPKVLVIIIAGSGPTNRSGNQVGGMNNSLRYLALDLAQNGVAAYSYDKRIFAQMIAGDIDEGKLRFDDMIQDCRDVIRYFRQTRKYQKIVVAGHSEGSLIGMVAANGQADGFISMSGAGRPADVILKEQISAKMPSLATETEKAFTELKQGKLYETENPMLLSIFRKSVQPYLMSWMQYDPKVEISKLKIPVLITNGTKDLQIPPSDAELLHSAQPKSKLVLIDGMNHVLKHIDGGESENLESYGNPDLPDDPQFLQAIRSFLATI